MSILLSKLHFFFTSKNQHGLHSPFVYELTTRCLYLPKKHRIAWLSVLLKCLDYFEVRRIYQKTQNPDTKRLLEQHLPPRLGQGPPYGLLFFESAELQKDIQHLAAQKDLVIDNSVFFLKSVRSSEAERRNWKSLIESQNFHLSLDLFYCGLLFFRKEQAKEHFKIRI